MRTKTFDKLMATAAAAVVSVLMASCNSGNGFTTFPAVTPAQTGAVASHVAKTTYYVHVHPMDAPTLATLQKIHDQWHAGGIRMEYGSASDAFYDTVVANAHAAGLQIAFITPATTTTADVAAYAQAAGVAAKRYAGNQLTWELYNEPDLLFDGSPNATVSEYITLAKATAIGIRANDPTAQILTGGTSGKDKQFTFAIAAGKALAPFVNGVSIHPYSLDPGSFGPAIVAISEATSLSVYISEWSSNSNQGLGDVMTAAKGLTPMFCAYEYQEQSLEKTAGDPTWGLIDTGAWSAFAAAAQ